MTKLAKLCSLFACLVLLYALSMGPVARFTVYPLDPRYEQIFNRVYSPIFRLRSISPTFSTPINSYLSLWAPGYDLFEMPLISPEPYPAETSTLPAATSSSPASPQPSSSLLSRVPSPQAPGPPASD
jgi:hypothetical protein